MSSRGVPADYDAAVRRPNYGNVGPLQVEASTRAERPRRRPENELSFRDLIADDRKPPGWP